MKEEKITDMDVLEKTISTILIKLNMNFFEERGIKFKAGHHGTWLEMRIIDVFWGARDNSVGTIDDIDLHNEDNSFKMNEPGKKYNTLGNLKKNKKDKNFDDRNIGADDSMDNYEMDFP